MKSAKFLLMLLTLASNARAASPGAPGLYQAGDLGFIDVSIDKSGWTGKFRGGGTCGFAPGTEVLSGQVEGGVFGGTVLLCQTGPNCENKKYPFLGVWRAGELAGNVHLDSSCSSSALENGMVRIAPASAEDRGRFLPGEGTKAAELAEKGGDPAAALALAREDMTRGIAKVRAAPPDYKGGKALLLRGLEYDKENVGGLCALGVAQMHLGEIEQGRKTLELTIALGKDRVKPSEMAEFHYNLACALALANHPREAVDALRVAVKLGGLESYREALKLDDDLKPIRDSPEFRKFYANEVVTARDKPRKQK